MADILCAIDPGHGGRSDGAYSLGKYTREADLTLAVALAAHRKDHRLLLTRTDDQTIDYRLRARWANTCNVDFVVCVHFDSRPDDPNAHGLDAYYNLGNGVTRRVARYAINNAPAELRGGKVICADDVPWKKNARFLVTVYPMDCLLLEMGFLSSKRDLKYIIRTDGIEACADLVLACCDEYRFIVTGEKHGRSKPTRC